MKTLRSPEGLIRKAHIPDIRIDPKRYKKGAVFCEIPTEKGEPRIALVAKPKLFTRAIARKSERHNLRNGVLESALQGTDAGVRPFGLRSVRMGQLPQRVQRRLTISTE